MGRDRFFQLLKFQHFVDNSAYDVSDPNRDKLFKMREMCEMFRERCKTVIYTRTECRHRCVFGSLRKIGIQTKQSMYGIKIPTQYLEWNHP